MPINRGALASILGVVSERRRMEEEERKERRKFAQTLVELGIKHGLESGLIAVRPEAIQGAVAGEPLAAEDLFKPGTGVRMTRPVDPIVNANRIAQLQSRLQGLEEGNALAPMLARQKQLETFPETELGIFKPGPGLFGGFTDRPNRVQRFFGVQQRPPVGTIPTVDTSFLKSQLLNATGQGDDPIVRTGTDTVTGRRVGLTRSGQVVPLD